MTDVCCDEEEKGESLQRAGVTAAVAAFGVSSWPPRLCCGPHACSFHGMNVRHGSRGRHMTVRETTRKLQVEQEARIGPRSWAIRQ